MTPLITGEARLAASVAALERAVTHLAAALNPDQWAGIDTETQLVAIHAQERHRDRLRRRP